MEREREFDWNENESQNETTTTQYNELNVYVVGGGMALLAHYQHFHFWNNFVLFVAVVR